MKKSVLAKAVSILLIVILIIGIGCFIFIPELYDMFKGSDIDLFEKHMLIYRLAFYMCYIIFFSFINSSNFCFTMFTHISIHCVLLRCYYS